MSPGDVALATLPQSGGGPQKLRPVLVVCQLPGRFSDVLLCGISTQLSMLVPDWDELIQPGDVDFAQSGLRRASIIRLSYLHSLSAKRLPGPIGRIEQARLERIQQRLSDHLHP